MSPWVLKPDGSTEIVGPQGANHHWWPGGLSKFWEGEDGAVGCVRRVDGGFKVFRTMHRKLGGQRDGHSNIFGEHRDASPWNQSEEHVFDDVDNSMGEIVERLQAMALQATDTANMEWHPTSDEPMLRNALAPALVSLCLRNPHSRFLASSMGRRMMGYERGSREDKNVSLSNILAGFRAYSKHLNGKGRFGVFVAQNGEFIYGDGCFHNVPARSDIFPDISMLVPITPKIAVGYRLPSSYMTDPMFCVMNVDVGTVVSFNDLVQIYSEAELFFSNIEPELSSHFKTGEFQRIQPQHNTGLYWLNHLPGLR